MVLSTRSLGLDPAPVGTRSLRPGRSCLHDLHRPLHEYDQGRTVQNRGGAARGNVHAHSCLPHVVREQVPERDTDFMLPGRDCLEIIAPLEDSRDPVDADVRLEQQQEKGQKEDLRTNKIPVESPSAITMRLPSGPEPFSTANSATPPNSR